MKYPTNSTVLAMAVAFGWCATAQENPAEETKPLCPMVSEALEDGLFQLVEVIGPEGDVGVAMPGDVVTLKFTIINHSDRSIMVSEEHLFPLTGSIESRTDNLEEFLQTIPEEDREKVAGAVESLGDGLLYSGGLDLPRAKTDMGFARRWIMVARGKNAWCACCQRHMQHSNTIEIRLPEELWTSVTLSLNQFIPAILLGPEERVTLKSKLDVVIRRKE